MVVSERKTKTKRKLETTTYYYYAAPICNSSLDTEVAILAEIFVWSAFGSYNEKLLFEQIEGV